jgi:hypothetical protein
MRQVYLNAIDWMSVKLNAVCLLGFLTNDGLITALTGIATITTIAYNGIKIYKEIKTKNKES